MITVRSWSIPLLLVSTVLLAVPLWQLGNHATAGHYKQYLFDNVSRYFNHPTQVYNNTLYQDGANDGKVHAQYNFSMPCDGFPDTQGIMLVMKTGATESFTKLPTQLLTSLQCLPDFLLFSDLEQQIGKYHIHDALDRVDETIRNSHREFDLYANQLKCPISQTECSGTKDGGWDLDKYKFLNMIQRTWEKKPDMEWYVFAEADTYIVWSNLVYWLREKAPRDDLYVGSVAMINGYPFAHGGSGYVLSGSLIRKMMEQTPNLAAKYDERAGNECCGDLLLSIAIQEAGGTVRQAHPMFNGEKPNTLPYGPGQWCEPLLTMHHMNPEEVSAVWQYEQTRTNKTEILMTKDLYDAFMSPHLNSVRRDWDNLSDDQCFIGPDEDSQNRAPDDAKSRQKKENEKSAVEMNAHLSAGACSKVCEASRLGISDQEYLAIEHESKRSELIRTKYEQRRHDRNWAVERSCFQWRYHKGACCTSRSFKLGKPRRESKEDDKWASGWFTKGIHDWIDAKGECKEVAWKNV